jgi:tetratricopeptide (TPR) repeat protein
MNKKMIHEKTLQSADRCFRVLSSDFRRLFAALRRRKAAKAWTQNKNRWNFSKIITCSLFCILLLSSSVFAQRNARVADALFKEGETLFGKDDAQSLEQALFKFDEARKIRINLRDRRNEALATFFIGRTYSKLNNAEGTVKNYLAAMQIFQELRDKTGEASVLNNLAAFLRNNGEYADALKYYQMAIPLYRQYGSKSDIAKALNGIGQTYLAIGNYQNAVEHLEESLEVWNTIVKGDDDKIRAIYNLGIAHYRLGNKDETVKYANQALGFARQRNNPALEVEVLENIAQIYDETGDLKTAVDYRKKALETYQRAGKGRVSENAFDTVVNNLGDLYYRMGELTTAEKLLTQNIRSGTNGKTHPAQSYIFGTLGEVFTAKGEMEKAVQSLNKSIEIARDAEDKNSEAYDFASLGMAYLNQADMPQAIDSFNRALSLVQAGTNPAVEGRALSGLMLAYTFTGNQSSAKQAMSRAEKGNLDKGTGTWTIQILTAIGQFYIRFNQHSQAVQKLEQALLIAGQRGNMIESASLISILGTAYGLTGNFSKALEFYERAIKIWHTIGNKPAEMIALDGAAWVSISLNQYTQSTNYAQQSLRFAEMLDNEKFQIIYRISALHALGKSAAKSKDSASAINYYTQALTLSERAGDAAGQKHFLNDIADAYENSGDKKQAKNYRNMAKKIKD